MPVVAVRVAGNRSNDRSVDRAASRSWRRLRRDPAFWLGAAITAAVVGVAVAAPLLAPHDPNTQFRDALPTAGIVGPTARYPLGADPLGRDLLSRLIHATRTSVLVGVVANGASVLFGTLVGSVAAYVGTVAVVLRQRGARGRGTILRVPVGSLLMRATDLVLAFPSLLLAIALAAVLGPSLALTGCVVAAVLWTSTARIVYATVVVLREAEFVLAARTMGVTEWEILRRHVLPHTYPLVVAYGILGVSNAILFESALSYLGVGVPPPAASWGSMVADATSYYTLAPQLVAFPGLALITCVVGFTLLGDAMRDALDPRLAGD